MKKISKYYLYPIVYLFIIGLIWYFIRVSNFKELDDVSPEIECENELLKKSDILWVIPLYNNKSISENKNWCSQILSLNKTLGLHGIYHTYKELDKDRNEEYIKLGIDAFENCFGFKPTIFKPSHLALNENNKLLIVKNNLKPYEEFNQLTHKVYHCSDTGLFSNKIIDIF